jgi:hypothetical protein
MSASSYDPTLGGYVPAIPEPFWHKSWRTWFRWRPQCPWCKDMPIFKTRAQWDSHYVLTHLVGELRSEGKKPK